MLHFVESLYNSKMTSLTILHFNDVYNIEGQKDEPQGGAARMKTYIESQKELDPLVLFSGDALNPSLSKFIVMFLTVC